ncbi:Cholesterol 24-hydroxylase [Holothuria leucospilota]|uniref:Cholesterol 24-hydroxylase n=1 Tax=Holothuria leucospilota TaxID=206669 RepID=A0A9Q1CIQ1_HOLLE|nr:Cholesterol 24-hydroxylase [Holothuria leucospilota]
MLLRFILLAIGVVCFLVFALCMYILSKIIFVRWKYSHLPTPKMKSFLLGHAMYFEEMYKKGGHISMLFSQWNKTYGPIFVIFAVHRVSVMCMEPSIVKELLINTKSTKPAQFYSILHSVFGQRFLGTGLLSVLDNTVWEERRKMFNTAFKRGFLIDLLFQYDESAERLISYLLTKADGETEVLMYEELNKLSLDVIAKVAFGLNDLDAISEKGSIFSEAAADSLHGCMSQMQLSFFAAFDFRKESRRVQDKAKKGSMLIRDIGRRCILKRIQDIKEGRDYPNDILTHILQVSSHLQNNSVFGMEEMLDEFVTFFVAGQETTASLMAFTFEYLGRYPDIYKKVQEEIDDVVGNKQSISYDDICKLEYLSLVLKEVLRLSPPVVGVQRINPKDLYLNGYKIPAGSNIGLNHYTIGRDERFWDDPEKFNPERFRKESNSRVYAYFPFSLGPRVCIGQHFALIEAKVTLTKLLQRFDFILVPGVEFQCFVEVTLKPKNKTPFYLIRRFKK